MLGGFFTAANLFYSAKSLWMKGKEYRKHKNTHHHHN